MICNASEFLPHRGRPSRWRAGKRMRRPPGSSSKIKDFEADWSTQNLASRGLKRAFEEETTETDNPSCSKDTSFPDRNSHSADLACSASQQPTAIEDASSARLESRPRRGYLATASQRKLSAGCVPVMMPSSDHLESSLLNDSEEIAEIRAEILDGARHLLQDESEIECLVELSVRLREKNTALLERAIHRRGVAECMQILQEALTVEADGGQLTAEGRRRTPGGVFLRLLQDRISREDKRFIWDEQNREQRMLKRRRMRNRRAAESPKDTETQRECTDEVLQSQRVPPSDSGLEEREPGELSANECASS